MLKNPGRDFARSRRSRYLRMVLEGGSFMREV
jgi:hypothetical protein